jgi:hypothetical protein
MNKYPLIGGSILAVVLLILGSLTNVVGYQTVQSSNQKVISTEINEKELLFQTILDITNNRDIQRVILGSEITGKRFFDIGLRSSVFNPPVLTEKFLERMYTMGVILSKTLSKSMIHSMLERFQVSNQGVQKEISAVIEKDASTKNEIMQLSSSSCDCENENTTVWNFPISCAILYSIVIFDYLILSIGNRFQITFILIEFISAIMIFIGAILNCDWIIWQY